MNDTKKCNVCKVTKPYDKFGSEKRNVDGLRGNCNDCRNSKRRKYLIVNKQRNSKVRKAYRKVNKEKIREEKSRHYKKHREPILLKRKEYAKDNREKLLSYAREHYRSNKPKYIARVRYRECRLKTGINSEFIDRLKEIYYVSEALGIVDNVKYNVDHIIPLTHDLVSGLNVPWNMQVLTEAENRSKKNKFDGTYINESWRLTQHVI